MALSSGEHLKVREGELIGGRYKVIREVGCGNFSKVYSCFDVTLPREGKRKIVAAKIVKREYKEDAFFEKQMLQVILEKDPSGTASVCQMVEFFEWKKCPVLVMSIHGPSLHTRRLGFAGGVVTRDKLVRMAYSFLDTIRFIHFDCRMVHTDIKPENILIDILECSKISFGNKWILCDFGNASLWRMDHLDSCLISTRPYRAPEVILGIPWFYAADMWSVGCILFEVATGQRLFDVRDDNTHLQVMEKRLGPLPELYTRRSKNSVKYFSPKGNFLVASEYMLSGKVSTRSLKDFLYEDPELHELIRSMLIYDPMQRITANDALRLPIFDKLRAMDATRGNKLDSAALSSSRHPSAYSSQTKDAHDLVDLDSATKNTNNSSGESSDVTCGKSGLLGNIDSAPHVVTKEPHCEDTSFNPNAHLPLSTAEVPTLHKVSPHRRQVMRKIQRISMNGVRSPVEPCHRVPAGSASSPFALSSNCTTPWRDRHAATSFDVFAKHSVHGLGTAAPQVDSYRAHMSLYGSSEAELPVPPLSKISEVKMPMAQIGLRRVQGTRTPHIPFVPNIEKPRRLAGATTRIRVAGTAGPRDEARRSVTASIPTYAGDTEAVRLRGNPSSGFIAKRRGEPALLSNAPGLAARRPTVPQRPPKHKGVGVQRKSLPVPVDGMSSTINGSFLPTQSKSLQSDFPEQKGRNGPARDVLRARRNSGMRMWRAYASGIPLYKRIMSQGSGRAINSRQVSRKSIESDARNDSGPLNPLSNSISSSGPAMDGGGRRVRREELSMTHLNSPLYRPSRTHDPEYGFLPFAQPHNQYAHATLQSGEKLNGTELRGKGDEDRSVSLGS